MIEQKIKTIKQKIFNKCKYSRINPENIAFVAVTKYVSVAKIEEAINLGINNIAESRIQESQNKFKQLSDLLPGVKKHFIGHLQTNKAKKAVEIFDLIQSVDSFYLAEEINKYAKNANKIQECLLELKVSHEERKFGILPEEVLNFIEKIADLKNIKISGLMVMAPYFENSENSRPYFQLAKKIFDKIRYNNTVPNFNILSMGMSNDFEIAIEEGSTMIRIGSAIFKE